MRNSHTAFLGFRYCLWLSLCLLFFCSNTTRADTITLTENTKDLPIGQHIAYLQDPGGQLSIGQVSSSAFANRFISSQQRTPNFGYSQSAYWFRFTVQNNSHDISEWFLVQQFANTHHLDLYIPQDNGESFIRKQSGNLLPYAQRDLADRNIVFQLPLATGAQKTFYLRVLSGTPLSMDLHIWEPRQFIISANLAGPASGRAGRLWRLGGLPPAA